MIVREGQGEREGGRERELKTLIIKFKVVP